MLEVLATAIRQEKEIKGIQIGKEKVKGERFVRSEEKPEYGKENVTVIIAADMIVYIENRISSTKKTTCLNKCIWQNRGIQSQYSEIESIFCIPTMKYKKEEQGKNPIYYSNKKNKVPRNKLNQGGKRPAPGKLQNTEETEKDTNKWQHMPRSWFGELTLLKCLYYPKQLIDSVQSLLKYQ